MFSDVVIFLIGIVLVVVLAIVSVKVRQFFASRRSGIMLASPYGEIEAPSDATLRLTRAMHPPSQSFPKHGRPPLRVIHTDVLLHRLWHKASEGESIKNYDDAEWIELDRRVFLLMENLKEK